MNDYFPSSTSFGRRPDIHGSFLGLFGIFAGSLPEEVEASEPLAPKPEPEYDDFDAGPSDSCYCAVLAMPPCGWCESCVDCEVCGEFVPEDDMAVHLDAKHPQPFELLSLIAHGKIWRTIPAGSPWLGPPNDECFPISAGEYTAEVHALFDRGLVEGRMASAGHCVGLVLTDAGRALLDTLNKPEGD